MTPVVESRSQQRSCLDGIYGLIKSHNSVVQVQLKHVPCETTREKNLCWFWLSSRVTGWELEGVFAVFLDGCNSIWEWMEALETLLPTKHTKTHVHGLYMIWGGSKIPWNIWGRVLLTVLSISYWFCTLFSFKKYVLYSRHNPNTLSNLTELILLAILGGHVIGSWWLPRYVPIITTWNLWMLPSVVKFYCRCN